MKVKDIEIRWYKTLEEIAKVMYPENPKKQNASWALRFWHITKVWGEYFITKELQHSLIDVTVGKKLW